MNSAFPKRRKFGPKIEVYLWETNLKANVCKNSTFQVNRKKNGRRRRRLTLSNRAAIRRTTQQTLLAINLASQQKTTKLYFSSQVKKQLKLLTVSFKPLRCCLRSDKLLNCHVWKFYKDIFLNFRVIWFVNQIILFNGFFLMVSCLILLRSPLVYILKQLFCSISVNSGFRNIYLASFAAR